MKEYRIIEEPTKRIKALLESFEDDFENRNWHERDKIYKKSYSEHEDLPPHGKHAYGLVRFLEEKEIVLREYDLLAGNIQHYEYAVSQPLIHEIKDHHTAGNAAFDVRKESDIYLSENGNDPEESHLLSQMCDGHKAGLFLRWGSGHVVSGYKKVVLTGLQGIIDEGTRALEITKDQNSRENFEYMIMVLKGAQNYIKRYADKAKELYEKTENDEYKVSLKRIWDSCDYLSYGKPRSFFEAVQLFILTHDVIFCESISGSLSLGRVDQWLYPFYERDIKSGKLNREEAQELIDALWLKLNMAMNSFQNVTLGGSDEYDRFAGNDVSLMCMRASLHIKMAQPLVSFRWREDIPEIFWDEIMALIRSGMGFPALFCDKTVYESKLRGGVSPEDVWNYSIVGCVEQTIEGDEYSNTEEMRISWAKILELMMFGGKCGITGLKIDMAESHDLDEFKTFEEFYAWYKREMERFIRISVRCTNMLEKTYGKHWPAPFLSSTMNNAFRTGKDVTQGNAKYSFSSINGTGMADAVDSLYAIKELVFERKIVSLSRFGEILRDNYDGNEPLRKMAENLPNRYGTDSAVTNEILKDLCDHFIGTVCSSVNIFGNRYQAGLYSVNHHAAMGEKTSALPSGRKERVSLANALAPCQGVDTRGPTATANSALNAGMYRCGNGMVLDMKFLPQFLAKDEHRTGLKNLIRTYFKKGGMEIQFNVVDRNTLINAQKNPENYKNLIVRVSGYSANFVYLDTTLQNEIIARTEFGGV